MACNSATINGIVYTTSQTVRDTLVGASSNGADSIVNTLLTINNAVTSTQNVIACNIAIINGNAYTTSQTVRDTLLGGAATGCDSIVVTTLTINSTVTSTQNVTANGSATINGVVYTASQIIRDTLLGASSACLLYTSPSPRD